MSPGPVCPRVPPCAARRTACTRSLRYPSPPSGSTRSCGQAPASSAILSQQLGHWDMEFKLILDRCMKP